MRPRTCGGSRRAASDGTDGRSLETALAASSLLLWLPYSLAAVYVAYCSSFVSEEFFTGGTGVLSNAGVSGNLPFSVSRDDVVLSSAPVANVVPSAPSRALAEVVGRDASVAEAQHHHRFVSYYIFPLGFDIAVFVPLLLRVLAFSAAAVLVTYYLSVHKYNGGEYLMAVAWALGTFSGYGWLYSSAGLVPPSSSSSFPSSSASTAAQMMPSAAPPSWLWLVVSLLTGLFSGILCKVKDIVDGKHAHDTHLFPLIDHHEERVVKGTEVPRTVAGSDRENCNRGGRGLPSVAATESVLSPLSSVPRYRRIRMSTSHHLVSLGDRLYMVVPFCTGQWFSFILLNGWRGIIVENGTVLLSLGLVGYTMLSYKFLKRQVLRVSGRVTRSAAACSRERRSRCFSQQQGSAPLASQEKAEEDVSSAEFLEDLGEVAVVDVIELISKLFTTSFGVVVLVVVGLNLFMTTLCIPFLKALFKLNALVSGVGIVIELIMYEVA